MSQRVKWSLVAVILAVVSLSQPWSTGAAQAGSGAKPTAPTAACKDTRAALADAQTRLDRLESENRELRNEVTTLLDAERARAKKLADQLGSPMIERLH